MAKIKRERMIGLTDAAEAALAMVEDFSGLKPSQYCRQAIIEQSGARRTDGASGFGALQK